MAKLKTYLIMPSRNSKQSFFSQTMRDLVISTKFSMNSITKLYIFPNFRYKCRTISNEEKKFTSPSISSYAFPNVTRTSPKLVYFKETSGTVMHGKNSTASDEKMQRFRIKTARTYVEPLPGKIGKIMAKLKTYLIMPSRKLPNKSFFSQTMRDLVISTKFQWIPLQIVHFPNFRYKCRTISNEEKKVYKSQVSLPTLFPNVTRQVQS